MTTRAQMRIVLTWSKTPADLDSYLSTPDGCVINYRARHCKRAGTADLDVDNRKGFGPETITIRKPVRATSKQKRSK